jgi:signal transduction histidine kinase
MVIKDNGQGFTSANQESANGSDNHFGIRGMREYAESIQAELNIESQSDQGTTITISLEANDGTGFDM